MHSGEDLPLGAHHELSFYRAGVWDDQRRGKGVPMKLDSEQCIPCQALSRGTASDFIKTKVPGNS